MQVSGRKLKITSVGGVFENKANQVEGVKNKEGVKFLWKTKQTPYGILGYSNVGEIDYAI